MRWWQLWKGTAKRDADLERELLSDLELEEEAHRERGLPAEEARSAARRGFGNTTLIREQTRAVWSWVWMERLVRDVQYGTRTLLRSPEFAIVSVLVMDSMRFRQATIATGAARPTALKTWRRCAATEASSPVCIPTCRKSFRAQAARPISFRSSA
jgi:hypothetical protein